MPSSAVSPATAISPSAPAAIEPATVVAAAPVVPAIVATTAVAAPTKEAVVAGAGSRAGSPPTATTIAASAADKVRDDANYYTCADHEQDNQKQFHGTILPVDVPGCKDSILPVCVRSLQLYRSPVRPCTGRILGWRPVRELGARCC